MRNAQTTNRTAGSTIGLSRTNEIAADAGVSPRSFSNISAPMPNSTATRPWPTTFVHARRPRLRCLEIWMKSSTSPTTPSPVMRNSTSNPLAVGDRTPARCAAR